MPIYEYKCPKCNSKYEKLQGMNAEHKYICPDCNVYTDRKYSTFGFTFDFKYGWDPGLGQYVDNKKQRENTLREKGLRKAV